MATRVYNETFTLWRFKVKFSDKDNLYKTQDNSHIFTHLKYIFSHIELLCFFNDFKKKKRTWHSKMRYFIKFFFLVKKTHTSLCAAIFHTSDRKIFHIVFNPENTTI